MLLFQLVQTLNDDELHKLQTIQLTPNEQKLLDYCISIRDKKLFAPTPALNKLQFSTAYLHKLTSVVLDKVLEHLYTPDFHTQIVNLSKKVKLVAVIRHLLKIHERQLLKDKDRVAMLALYETCFSFEISNYSSDYDKKLIRHYYKKCLEYADKKATPAYIMEMQIDELAADVNITGATGAFKSAKVREVFQKRFDDVFAIGEKYRQYNLLVKTLLVNSIIYFDMSKPDLALPYLEKATKLVEKYTEKIEEKHQLEVSMYNSRALYFLSRFDEAWQQYNTMNIIPRIPVKGIIYADVAKFIQVSLITGHYAKAKELLDAVFGRIIDAQNSAGTMARLHVIKYLVYIGKYKDAIKELDKLDQLVRDTKVFQYIIEARILYSIAELLDGNRYEAALSAERSLKFLYSKKQPEQLADFIEGFQLLKAYAKGSPINARLNAIQEKYQYNAYKQYGELFNRIRTTL